MKTQTNHSIQLGLGLIGIGREWGYVKKDIPSEKQTQEFLEHALKKGISFFDTAPSYGLSEDRLGTFLKTLTKNQISNITISTKCGEFWDKKSNSAYVDHSYDSLCKSIDQSLKILGRIDILQLHKTTAEVLTQLSFIRAFEYAQSCGISKFGVSVSDIESGKLASEISTIEYFQLPFNLENQMFEPIIDLAISKNKKFIINRPFGMGKILYGTDNNSAEMKRIQAYKFILKKQLPGYILTGTTSIKHLDENIEAFENAKTLI